MICDYQTNKVYLAEGIKGYPKVAENLLLALCDEGIDTDYLPQTKSKKHVWAPDYIPQYHSICRNLKLNCRKVQVMNGWSQSPMRFTMRCCKSQTLLPIALRCDTPHVLEETGKGGWL